MTDQERLQHLFLAQHPCISLATYEESDALELVCQTALEAQVRLLVWSTSRGLHDGLLVDSASIADTQHPAAALCRLATRNDRILAVMLDVAGHLKDEKTLRSLRDTINHFARTGSCLVLIDDSASDLPPVISAVATPFELSLPDDQAIDQVLRQTLRDYNQVVPVQVNLNAREMGIVIRNLSGLTRRQARQIIRDCICTDRRLDASGINTIVANKRRQFQGAGLLEYIEAPVDLQDIGGLNKLKAWLAQRSSTLSPEAAAFGITPPRGILMLGVQGAGKSLSAKAVATAWQRPLLRLDPGVLYDRFIGESERRLRDALRQAEMMAPIVLWIDEIEKGFASAASQSVDGGLSQRMFASLLTWMQEHKAPVFTIATANDITALPPKLLRKGRFDEIFFVDLPNLEARAAIFAIHLAKRNRQPSQFDLAALAAASDGYSGAEIEQAIVSALHDAFAARQELNTPHIARALASSPPLSVTMAERVAALRRWAQSRCVPAD